jgi:hypothetical protein
LNQPYTYIEALKTPNLKEIFSRPPELNPLDGRIPDFFPYLLRGVEKAKS